MLLIFGIKLLGTVAVDLVDLRINNEKNTIKNIYMAKQFTDSNFQSEVLNSDKPVLVDFWAEWCGPCRMVGPIVDEIASEYDGRVSVGKLNVDENPDVPSKYGIRSIPTLMVFKNGELVEKIVGAVPKSVITGKIEPHMA